VKGKQAESVRMDPQKATIVILATLFVSLALAEDFKTVSGKIYKDATISSVEADGIVLRTKTGISKVYFVELPKDVQERFHYATAAPTGKAVTQRIDKAESAKPAAAFVSDADRFAQQVAKKLDERESILQGKHTPGPAETTILREFAFHKAFLAGTAIIAIVLFAVVWARVK
jgi:superfamily II RNA helicase